MHLPWNSENRSITVVEFGGIISDHTDDSTGGYSRFFPKGNNIERGSLSSFSFDLRYLPDLLFLSQFQTCKTSSHSKPLQHDPMKQVR